jgi:seryl-tRNA synthetase
MKPKLLEKLIKKIQKEIDQSRIEKVDAERKIDQLNIRLQNLKDDLVKEQVVTSENVEFRHTYENFYKTNKTRQMNIGEEIKRLEDIVTEIEELLFEQFRTFKQYEILLNRYLQAQKDRIESEESKFLDELGIRRAG